MKTHFEKELKGLKQSLQKMGNMVSSSVNNAIKVATEGDIELAHRVIEHENKINKLEVNIDNFCLKLLALYQPAAADLRFITMAMKINNDLERIADISVNICERVISLSTKPQGKLVEMVTMISSVTENMVSDTINCFINNDIELAEKIVETEDRVDELNSNIIKELIDYLVTNPKEANKIIGYIFISKNLERLADHLEKIAQDVIFMRTGEVVRH